MSINLHFRPRVVGFLAAATFVAGCSASPGFQGSNAIPQGAPSFAHALNTDNGYMSLFSFDNFPTGRAPLAGLIFANGTLYGVTSSGGTGEPGACGLCGTVYSMSTTGSQTVLYTFKGRPNGAFPYAGLTSLNGVLYGTTFYGGNGGEHKCFKSEPNPGCGTVFELRPSGRERVLHAFEGGSDGSAPMGELLALNGKLYGTTTGEPFGHGTVFALSRSGREQVLYRFAGGPNDGSLPLGNLISVKGTLYGVTDEGGSSGAGTVFALSPSGQERILHSFNSSEGDYPRGGLALLNGTFYGTTSADGPHKRGTVYSITPGGEFHVIHSFKGYRAGDGAFPYDSLVAVNGALYGTTYKGGTRGDGAIFKLTPSGAESVLHSFGRPADGTHPWAALTYANGVLYGTTARGGKQGQSRDNGTVFRLSP